jgi:hypothetical protein
LVEEIFSEDSKAPDSQTAKKKIDAELEMDLQLKSMHNLNKD